METRILKIDEDTKLDRLDKILAEKLDFSRKRIKDLLDEGNVLVNQKVMKASYKVCVELESRVFFPLMFFLNLRAFGRCTGITFVDSTIEMNIAQSRMLLPTKMIDSTNRLW